MSFRIKLIICVIILLFTMYLVAVVFHREKNRGINEPFVSMSEDAQTQLRRNLGQEKCLSLKTYDPTLSNDSFEAMTNYVDGLRMKVWKPVDGDPRAPNIQPNKEYCYLYDDVANDTQDYVLRSEKSGDQTCSRTNPLFSSPLITNVFTTEYRDRTHNVPIQKCVFEIDRTATSNVEALNSFWGSWGAYDCHMTGVDLRISMGNKQKEHDELQKRYNELYDLYVHSSNNLTQQQYALSICGASNNVLKEKLDAARASYDHYNIKTQQVSRILEDLTKDINLLEIELQRLEKISIATDKDVHDADIKHGRCLNEVDECTRIERHTRIQWEALHVTNSNLTREIADFSSEIAKWTSEYTAKLEESEECTQNYTKMSELLRETTDKHTMFSGCNDQCQDQLASYVTVYNDNKNWYESSSNIYFTCDDERKGLQKSLEHCRGDTLKCIGNVYDMIRNANDRYQVPDVINSYDQASSHYEVFAGNINVMKQQTKEFQGKHAECIVENAKLVQDIEELKKRKMMMQEQLSTTNDHRLTLQNNSYETVAANVYKNTQDALQAGFQMEEKRLQEQLQNSCSQTSIQIASDFATACNERMRLLGVLDSYKREQPCGSNCQIEIAQCMIHKGHPMICAEPTTVQDGKKEGKEEEEEKEGPIAILYEHPNYKGRQMELNTVGYKSLNDFVAADFDNMVSGIKILRDGYKVTLYQHDNRSGKSHTFGEGQEYPREVQRFKNFGFHDTVSSADVEKI